MDALADKADITALRAEEMLPAARPTREQAEDAVKTLLAWAGDNPDREGLLDTPKRVAKAFEELFAGYTQSAADHLGTIFEEVGGYSEMVLVRDIPFHSHCEHHMVPFFGKVHIAYFPNGGVVGLSKLARVVDVYAKRLQTQENLTSQILAAVEDALAPRGIAIMVEAEHQCMSMRGVQKSGASTVTSQFTGIFEDDPAQQVRFMTQVRA